MSGAILTLGLGFGGASKLVTLGLGVGGEGVVIPGPYRTVAWQFYVPGSRAGQSFTPGSKAAQHRSPGSVSGQAIQ